MRGACPQNGRPEPPLKKPLPSKPVPKPSAEQQKALEKKVRSLPAGRKAALRWAMEAPPALRDAAWEAAMQAPLESLKLRPEAERIFKEAEEVPPQLSTSFHGKSVDVVVTPYHTGVSPAARALMHAYALATKAERVRLPWSCYYRSLGLLA